MTLAEIKELIQRLENIQEIEWSFGGNTRYETEVNSDVIIIDRRNNADKEISECYLKVGTFEQVFNAGTEEYELLSNFLIFLNSTNEF